MPSKGRWALNPRKWFGTISNAAHQRDKKPPSNNPIITLPPSVKGTRTDPSTTVVPRILASRNKTKVTPILTVEDNNYTTSTNTMGSFTQFHLPPFQARREKTTLLSASSNGFRRPKVVLPTRLEPSIRKNFPSKEETKVELNLLNLDQKQQFRSADRDKNKCHYCKEIELNNLNTKNVRNYFVQSSSTLTISRH